MAVQKRKDASAAAAAVADVASSATSKPIAPYFAPLPDHQLFHGFVIDDYRASQYISAPGIANLKYYKYTGNDQSFLGNLVLFRIYGWMAYQTPMWLAPNLITLAGLVCNFLALSICYWKIVPTFGTTTSAEPWVYFLVGTLLWAYQAFDNMDGKQARRTGSSSALGELFDHICDCTCVTVFTMIAASVSGLGVYWMLIISWFSIFGFHLAHWEEYYKGALIMGVFNGPTEAVLAIVAVCYATALLGVEAWTAAVPGVVGLTFGQLLQTVFCLSAAFTCVRYVRSTLAACEQEGVPLRQAIAELAPLLIAAAANGVWLWASVALNGVDASVVVRSPIAFTLQAGLFVAYIETRLLTQRICRERAPVVYAVNLPAVMAAILGLLSLASGAPLYDEVTVLLLVLALHLAFFGYLVVAITNQLTAALNIKVFTIPY